MHRYEDDDIDALGQFMLIGALVFLFFCLVIFMVWAGWL